MKNMLILVAVVVRAQTAATKAAAKELMSETFTNALTGFVEDAVTAFNESGLQQEMENYEKAMEEIGVEGVKWGQTVTAALIKAKAAIKSKQPTIN